MTRLDQELAARGIARSRTHAARLIASGTVIVDGTISRKASMRVSADSDITVDAGEQWVSRAALKLVAALDAFDVSVTGRRAIDVGASTGGFTQVLLAHDIAHVTAIDVGHGQFALDPDPRVTLVEGCNVRTLEPFEPKPDIIVCDVSFISASFVFAPVRATTTNDADWLVLIKPQFEVGRTGVKAGLVHDLAARADAVRAVLAAAWSHGLGVRGIVPSPVVGTHGNHEFLAWLRADGTHPTEWEASIVAAVRETA